MPGKEAVVEVEKAVVPEPVTKEVPKCEDASKDLKGKEEKDAEPVKTTEAAPVADSAESKPQDTEITSSVEQKADEEEPSSDKSEKEEASVESTNGRVAKSEKVDSQKESELNGEAKPIESPTESTVDASAKVKVAEATPNVESDVDASSLQVNANLAETKNSEADVAGKKPDPIETENTTEAEAVGSMETETKSSDAALVAKDEPMEDVSQTSEAAAKPLPAENEKIIVEKESNSGNPVGGSDEVTKKEAAQPEETKGTSADSSSEKKTENPSSSESNTEDKPGSSSTTEVKHDLEMQISELKKKGLALYVQKDYCAAADVFGKVLEVQAPIHGEMSEKLAETYFLYGSAMYEYGKMESGVLGEKIKEKDEEVDDEEEGEGDGDEQMEVDEKGAEPAETATEKSAKPRPSTPSDSVEGDVETDKEPAEVTITEDKEDDDDAFRVAWEMLELAKATFLKADNKKRLADTLVKLGEVGIEIENVDAVAEMEEGLKIRKEVYPANHRIISETHFNIGLAYAAFDKYDDAVQHFTHAKDCLGNRIEELSKSEIKEDKSEVEEMKLLLPEIQEKIDDTKESKADKEKLKEKIEGELLKKTETATPFPASSDDKPVSNISHLVKRKRKVDEALPERAAKQIRQEDDTDVASTTNEITKGIESPKPADNMDTTETEQNKDVKIDSEPEMQTKGIDADTKSEENPDTKTEGEPIAKSVELLDTETEEKQDTKSEENPETKSEEKLEPEEKTDEAMDVPKSAEMKPEETEKVAEPAKPEEKLAETETKSSEPEKMEE